MTDVICDLVVIWLLWHVTCIRFPAEFSLTSSRFTFSLCFLRERWNKNSDNSYNLYGRQSNPKGKRRFFSAFT